MKKILFLVLITLFCVEMKSQSISNSSKFSSEISIGLGKVGFIGKNDFVIDRVNCFDCNYKAIRKEGYEYNFNLTINRTINSKNEMYSGIGFNLWRYKVDNISGWTGESLGTSSDILPLLDLIVGYRFAITELIFIENTFHGEFNTKDIFNKFKFSVEPGIGFKIKLGDKLQLLPVLHYKQSLTNFSGLDYNKNKPYSIGVKLAINKTF